MCGLFASTSFPPDRTCIDIVAHRGPDGEGWREFRSPMGPVALGHRRLAIIDLSEGSLQPMADRSERFHLVFNGEIYNYLELRQELEEQGHVFLTEGDSEVLLTAYRAWGEACLDRLLGMFAFVVWDDMRKRMFAARDRFGIKPLYLLANSQGVAFASEIKQLLRLPGTSARMNLARVRDYLALGTSDHTSETMFDGVLQVPPGHCVTVDASEGWRGRYSERRWYALPPYSSLHLSEGEAAERFRELLTDAVRMHLRSDVAVGSCLSGGLDSSSIVCLMADMLGRERAGARVNSISACYSDKSVDEKPFMEAVVSRTGARPIYVFPRPEDLFDKAGDITWHQDEPFGSSSVFAQWSVFEAAREAGVKVMLDGQGADEQLAGYHFCYMYYMSDLIRRGKFLTVLRTMAERRIVHGASLTDQTQRFIGPVLPAPIRAFLLRHRERTIRHDWMNSEALRYVRSAASAPEMASALNGLPPVSDIGSLCVALTLSSNLQKLLHWEDRNAMAHSVEARVPFLDHRLVEFSLALGNDHKIVRSDTKRVLRRAMQSIIPSVVAERRDKLGFATPEQSWFRTRLAPLVLEGVEATLRHFPTLLNPTGTRRLVGEMLDDRRPVDFTLWRIVNLGIWGQRFKVSL